MVNPRGQVAVGHDAIRDALGSFIAHEAADSSHTSSIHRVSFVTDDVAIADGNATIALHNPEREFEHPFTDVLRREPDGHWLIGHVRAYHFEPGP